MVWSLTLEPEILECEVKGGLGSITTNKASWGDEIPVELFQILKGDAVEMLYSVCQQIWKMQQWPQDWKCQFSSQCQRRAVPKNVQTTSQLHHFTTSKVMLKILQTRLQQCMNWQLPDVEAVFRKGRGIRDQIASIRWIIEKAREFQKKNIYFIDYSKDFDCGDYIKRWKILKEMGIPDHLTCLPRNLYTGQEGRVRIRHGTTDPFQIGKGVPQGYIWSPCLFNLYAEYIMQNAGLDYSQAGNKIAGRNINNLWYADDNTLTAESEEKVRRFLMRMKKGSEKAGLKLHIQKINIIASGPITLRQIKGEKNRSNDKLFFLGLQNHCGWWLQPWN